MKKPAGQTKQLDPKIAELEAQVAESQAKVARALADYANLERRFASESSAVVKFATSSLLEKLLDIRDHLAMASVVLKDQSVTMILSSLDKLLTEEGVTQVKTDGLFDPHTMESQELVDGEKDKVIQVIRPGYRLHDRVLRNARVTVGNGNITKQ
jgi:molecular chaperone GrpE